VFFFFFFFFFCSRTGFFLTAFDNKFDTGIFRRLSFFKKTKQELFKNLSYVISCSRTGLIHTAIDNKFDTGIFRT